MSVSDVIVVGAGVYGASCALALARSGRRTLVLEQFEVGHERGSSHGDSRIIRRAYETAEYSRLAEGAFTAWREIERDSGATLLVPSEHLDLAPSGHGALARVAAAMTEGGTPFSWLEPEDLSARYPQFRLPNDYAGVLDPNAGILFASRAVRVLTDLAVQAGAELRTHSRVTRLEATASGVRVYLADETLETHALVVAGGAWTNALLAPLGARLPLAVYRTQSAHFQPREPEQRAHALGSFPLFYDHVSSVYGIPAFDGHGLKIGDQHREPADPDTRSFEAIPADLERLGAWVERALPGVERHPEQVQTCLYTDTPDADFILDRVPGVQGVVVLSACSGHGFKFAPVLGGFVADLLDGAPPPARFAWERFAALRGGR